VVSDNHVFQQEVGQRVCQESASHCVGDSICEQVGPAGILTGPDVSPQSTNQGERRVRQGENRKKSNRGAPPPPPLPPPHLKSGIGECQKHVLLEQSPWRNDSQHRPEPVSEPD